MKRITIILAVLAAPLTSHDPLEGQIPNRVRQAVPKVELPEITLDDLLGSEAPITTSLEDAMTEVSFLDRYDPSDPLSLVNLPRGVNGAFLVYPGVFELDAKSYCLKAGTHAPGAGNGYLFAPLAGSEAGSVRRILQGSASHPEITQRNIQQLLWAIIARAKFEDLSRELQAATATLLSPEEIASLNRSALDLIPEDDLEQLVKDQPPLIRQTLEAEAQLRGMLTSAEATYEEMEAVAVLLGEPGPDPADRHTPAGRWSYHPDGYFVRYLPRNYTRTRSQVSFPEPFIIASDAQGRITTIADWHGDRIETDYGEAAAPFEVSEEAGVQAYHFSAVRFIEPDAESAVGTRERGLVGTGWTFVGIPNPDSRVEAQPAGLPGVAARFESAKTDRAEIERILLGVGASPGAPANDVTDLEHYVAALTAAGALEDDGVATLLAGARQFALCRAAGDCGREGAFGHLYSTEESAVPPAPPGAGRGPSAPAELPVMRPGPSAAADCPNEYDPSGSVAIPGDAQRQRLGQSGLPADDEDGGGESGDADDPFTGSPTQNAFVRAFGSRGSPIGPEHTQIGGSSKDIPNFTSYRMRLGRDFRVLPEFRAIMSTCPERGSIEGTWYVLIGFIQKSHTRTRTTMKLVSVETGVILNAGKGDADGLGPKAIEEATGKALDHLRVKVQLETGRPLDLPVKQCTTNSDGSRRCR